MNQSTGDIRIKSLAIKVCKKCKAYIYSGDKKNLENGDLLEFIEVMIRRCSRCEDADPQDARRPLK